jgi:hypothetical protein
VVLAALLLVLFVSADFAIAFFIDPHRPETGSVVLGITFAQIVLLATWTALAPASLSARIVSGLAGVILLSLALMASIERANARSDGWLWLAIVLSQWCVIQFPLWILRLRFDWRLCWPGEEIVASTRSDTQFEIRQVMIWTALVCVALGVGRQLVPEQLGTVRDHKETLIIFSMLTVFSCLLAWPVVWAVFAPRWWGLWLIGAAVGCVGLTLAEIETLVAVTNQRGEAEFFWIMNSLQAFAASITLIALRVSGFRLVRAVGAAGSKSSGA